MEESSLKVDESFDIAFRNKEFLINVRVHNSRLYLEVEDKYEGLRWTGTFISEYIEDITRKTRSFRKFPVFIDMLLQALRKESDIVYIDLLTMQDLLLLKASKGGGSTDVKAIPPSKTNNKRYLILTHVGEYDHVHYPLNLCFDDNPPVPILQRTITRLSQELSNFKRLSMSQSDMSSLQNGGYGTQSEFFQQSNSFEIASVMSENEELKKEIRKLETDSDDEETEDEFKEKLRIKLEIQKETQKLKEEYAMLTKELESKNKTIDMKKLELRNTKNKFYQIQNNQEFSTQSQVKKQLDDMKKKLEEEKEMGGKAIQELEEEKTKVEKEFEEAQEVDVKLRARIKELETEINQANGKIDQLTMGYRRSTRSNSNQRNISPATSQKSRTSSNRNSPAHYRNTYNRPIALKNYTPPGARQNSQGRQASNQRIPLYRRNSPGQNSGSLNRNSQSKYSPGAWRQQASHKLSTSPAARAAGVVPGPRRVTNNMRPQQRESPGRAGGAGSTVFDRLYARSKRNVSKEASPGVQRGNQMRGRSKDPSPGVGTRFSSNKDIKPMLSQNFRGSYRAKLQDQNEGVSRLAKENDKPNLRTEGVKQEVRGKEGVDLESIDQRIVRLQNLIKQSKE